MNRRVRQAVLRILMLTEEFTPEELTEAVSLAGGQKEEDLLAFLKRLTSPPRRSADARSQELEFRGQRETRALQELKSVDGEKYQLLREFETAIREGKALKSLDDFRAFGKQLGKGFTAGKSRKEALGRLMAILAHMDTDSIKVAIEKMPLRSGEEEESFRRLANQIMSGSRDRTSAASG